MLAAPRRKRRRLSLTPLVDVIFLLLLFFMLSSTFLRFSTLDIAARSADPNAATSPSIGRERAAHIKLRSDGSLAINGATVPESLLAEELTRLGAMGAERVLVTAERGVAVQPFVTLMERLSEGPLTVVVVGGRPRPAGVEGAIPSILTTDGPARPREP